jgi:hypothetical protein
MMFQRHTRLADFDALRTQQLLLTVCFSNMYSQIIFMGRFIFAIIAAKNLQVLLGLVLQPEVSLQIVLLEEILGTAKNAAFYFLL